MMARSLLIALALVATPPALAQGSSQTAPPGTQQGAFGQTQQSSEFRGRATEQAPMPQAHPSAKRHPGTVRKFYSYETGAPVVQFDLDRRAASEAAKAR